jgi:hypothetical protein
MVQHDHVSRIAMATAIAVWGLVCMIWPECMTRVAGLFRAAARGMTPPEQDRLRRILAAREDAEGVPQVYGYYFGAVAIALAGLEFIREIPYVVPYALVCLASALLSLLAYVRFHHATQRRTAPLVPRSPFAALPPVMIAASVCVFALTVPLAFYPQVRLSALIVIAAALILSVVSWRIAIAPAFLIGDDPQWEYAVDERVRIGRARGVATLACTVSMVLVVFAAPTLPDSYRLYVDWAPLTSSIAFLVTILCNASLLRRHLSVT